jgi:WD40 repeat protein
MNNPSIFNLIRFSKGHKSAIYSACFSSNNKYLITGSEDNSIILWSLWDFKEIRTFIGHNGRITNLTFSNDNNFIISIARDYHVIVWDIFSGAQLKNFEIYPKRGGSAGIIGDIVFLKDKIKFSHKKFIYLDFWDITENKVSNKITINLLGSDYDLFNTKNLVISSTGNEAIIRDIETGEIVDSFYFKIDLPFIMLKLSWDDSYLAIGTISDFYIIDLATKKVKYLLKGHRCNITNISFSTDNKFVATGSQDGKVIVWDLDSGLEISQFETGKGYNSKYISVAIFSPDNSKIFISNEVGENFIWSFKTSKSSELKSHKNDLQFNLTSFTIENSSIEIQNNFNPWSAFIKGDPSAFWNGTFTKSINFAFSSDGKYFAIYTFEMFDVNSIKIYKTESNNLHKNIIISDRRHYAMISELKYNSITSLLFTSDNSKLYVFFKSNHFRVYSVEEGIELFQIPLPCPVISAGIIPGKNLYVTFSSDQCFRIYDFHKGDEIVRMFFKDSDSWLILTKDGQYDGSEKGLKNCYYVQNLEIKSLESLKYLHRIEGLYYDLIKQYCSE